MSDKKYEMDMCSGALFPKIIAFAFPLAVSGILQLLFNAADIVVVGRFVGKEALAAVGSTTAFINFIINLFMGLSVGAGVVVANCYGAGEKEALKESVHTAVMLSFVGGISLTVLGLLVSRPILSAMGNPPDVLDLSVLYIRIYFLSIPGLLFYNFGSAILRAAGDTKRPMYFLFVSGVLNVFLNIFFVVVMGLGVDGVAYATGISQYLSGFLVLYTLVRSDSDYKLILKEIKMYKYPTIKILKIGIPAGFQGMVFSLSNMLIQSSVNSFGSTAMAGNAAAQNVEGFVYVSMTAVYQTAMNFVSQNFGAHKFDRIKKIHFETLVLVFITGIVGGWAVYILCDKILLLYTANDKVISVAKLRLSVILTTYALCGAMDVMSGILRGLGHSSLPMVVSFLGACVFRVVWVLTVFTFVKRTLMALYISYPLSWAITFIIHTICYYFIIDYYKDKKF